jgi:hypothetical protein
MSEISDEKVQEAASTLQRLFAAHLDQDDEAIASAVAVAALETGADPFGETFIAVSAFMHASAGAAHALTAALVECLTKAENLDLPRSSPEFRQMMFTVFDSMVGEVAG